MNILKYLGVVLLIFFGALHANGQSQKAKSILEEILAAKEIVRFEYFAPFSINSNQAMKIESEKYMFESTILNLDQLVLDELYQSNAHVLSMKIPTGNGEFMVVDLIKSNSIPVDFLAGALSGERINNTINYIPGHYYKGVIEGDNSSLVSMSIFDDEIHGLILGEFGNMNLGEFIDTYIFFNDKPSNMKVSSDFTCGVSDDDKEIVDNAIELNTKSSEPAKNCIYFYFETAFDIYDANPTAAHLVDIINDVTANFNDVATIYINEEVKLVLNEVNAWTTADPYDYATSVTALNTFRDEMAITGYNARFAHLISSNHGNGGRAYLTSNWCTTSEEFRTAYSDLIGTSNIPFPAYSWNVQVIGHEIGHNLGSHHTQWCGWVGGAIDNCDCTEFGCALGPEPSPLGGTLMSYCHGIPDNTDCSGLNVGGVDGTNPGVHLAFGLATQPGDQIRANYNNLSNRACMHGCNCPANLFLTGTLAGISFEEANEGVYSNATLSFGASINFDGGEVVELYPGFNTELGNNFEAYIDGCGHLKNITPSELNENGLKDDLKTENPISLFPNPNNGQFNIKLDDTEDVLPQIFIYDLYGRVLFNFQMESKIHTVDLNEFPSGIILLRSIWDDHSFTNRVVIN